MPAIEQYYTVGQAAQLTQYSIYTIRELCVAGKILGATKPLRTWRIPESGLRSFLEKGCREEPEKTVAPVHPKKKGRAADSDRITEEMVWPKRREPT